MILNGEVLKIRQTLGEFDVLEIPFLVASLILFNQSSPPINVKTRGLIDLKVLFLGNGLHVPENNFVQGLLFLKHNKGMYSLIRS